MSEGIQLVVVVPQTPTPSRIDSRNRRRYMYLICCNFRIIPAQPGTAGDHGWPGHHRRTRQQKYTGDRLYGQADNATNCTGGAEESSRIHWPRKHSTVSVRSPIATHCPAGRHHEPDGTALLTARVQSYQTREHNQDPHRSPEWNLQEAYGRPMYENLRNERAVKTRDAKQSEEEVRCLRPLLANAVASAARVSLAAPLALEHRGQKFPDTPEYSGSDWTQISGWIARLQMVI